MDTPILLDLQKKYRKKLYFIRFPKNFPLFFSYIDGYNFNEWKNKKINNCFIQDIVGVPVKEFHLPINFLSKKNYHHIFINIYWDGLVDHNFIKFLKNKSKININKEENLDIFSGFFYYKYFIFKNIKQINKNWNKIFDKYNNNKIYNTISFSNKRNTLYNLYNNFLWTDHPNAVDYRRIAGHLKNIINFDVINRRACLFLHGGYIADCVKTLDYNPVNKIAEPYLYLNDHKKLLIDNPYAVSSRQYRYDLS